MTRLQKAVLVLGALALVANLVYPPWAVSRVYPATGAVYNERSFPRAFIWHPPERWRVNEANSVVHLNWPILGVTSLAIVLATGLLFGLAALTKKPKPN